MNRSPLQARVAAVLSAVLCCWAAVSAAELRYTVKKGDTLGGIAAAHGVSLAALQQSNGITDPGKLSIGKVLSIPQAGAVKTYTVKKGDTLGGIAAAHGLSVSDILKHNKISDPRALSVGRRLSLPPSASARVKEYTVRSGDTLGSIAVRHGLSASRLASYNNISNPNRLRIGQVLRIPSASAASARPRNQLATSMKRKLDSTRVRRGRWKKIVIHHSATKSGSMKGMDEYHRRERRMKNGLAYHFVIGNGHGMADGEIGVSRRWTRQLNGGHLYSESMNTYCLGICLVGNFDASKPTKKQQESLEALCRYLMQRCGISKSNVRTHTQINTRPTRCPGRNFPTRTLLDNL